MYVWFIIYKIHVGPFSIHRISIVFLSLQFTVQTVIFDNVAWDRHLTNDFNNSLGSEVRPSWRSTRGGGGTDLERGYGDVRPWRPPFHASPAARMGPILSKRVSSQDSLLRKFGNFSLYSLNFHPNFSSQAPKFGNFPLTSPPNLEIFRSQAPLFRGKCQFASPTLRKSGPHTPIWKKIECSPGGEAETQTHDHLSFIWTFQSQQYDVFVGYWVQKRWRHKNIFWISVFWIPCIGGAWWKTSTA